MDTPFCGLGDIEVFSWNVNGLVQKFDDLLGFLQLLQYPKIVALQETHGTVEKSIVWASKLVNYFCYFNHGTSASRGTAVFLHRS